MPTVVLEGISLHIVQEIDTKQASFRSAYNSNPVIKTHSNFILQSGQYSSSSWFLVFEYGCCKSLYITKSSSVISNS